MAGTVRIYSCASFSYGHLGHFLVNTREFAFPPPFEVQVDYGFGLETRFIVSGPW